MQRIFLESFEIRFFDIRGVAIIAQFFSWYEKRNLSAKGCNFLKYLIKKGGIVCRHFVMVAYFLKIAKNVDIVY